MIRSIGTPTVLLAGGGTGGHLFPGVATAEELTRRAPGSRVLLARTQKDAVSQHGLGVDLETVAVQSPRTPGNPLGLPIWAGRLAHAVRLSGQVLREQRPHVVVGLGGYGSVAPVLAARAAGVPVLLLEQNAVPGKATRFLSWFGATTAASFEGIDRAGVRGTVLHTGNPIRRCVLAKRPAHEELGLSPTLPVLAVVGGSLGASGLNARVAAAMPALIAATGGRDADGRARFQVLHGAGTEADAATLTSAYDAAGVRAVARPFFRDMGAIYGTSDLLVCRAGGTTVAEIAALGVPALFVPYPHHKDQHQERNALPLVAGGAASILRESALTPEALAAEAGPLLRDAALRMARADAARRLGRPDAAARVVDLILQLASRRSDS